MDTDYAKNFLCEVDVQCVKAVEELEDYLDKSQKAIAFSFARQGYFVVPEQWALRFMRYDEYIAANYPFTVNDTRREINGDAMEVRLYPCEELIDKMEF